MQLRKLYNFHLYKTWRKRQRICLRIVGKYETWKRKALEETERIRKCWSLATSDLATMFSLVFDWPYHFKDICHRQTLLKWSSPTSGNRRMTFLQNFVHVDSATLREIMSRIE